MLSERWGTFSSVSVILLCVMLIPGLVTANPDPCLMVYSDSPATYHYDPAEYYTVTVGHPLYDPAFDRGGEVLIDINTDEIALDIYQAPNLIGFVLDPVNQGIFIIGNNFTAIVDGWSNQPTTYTNILLVFDNFEPAFCVPTITVDGNPVLSQAGLGLYYPIGNLVVSTPTPTGNNYSDTVSFSVHWEGCSGVRLYAFSDANSNLKRDGNECFSAFSHDLTIPTEETTWGSIKSLYR